MSTLKLPVMKERQTAKAIHADSTAVGAFLLPSKQGSAPRSVEPEAKNSSICAAEKFQDNMQTDIEIPSEKVTLALPPIASKFIPEFATRSAFACWWSIIRLVEQNPGDCFLWTLTFKEVWPDNYCSNMHANLLLAIKNEERSGRWPSDWGGVKVVEEHPGGHGLHFHWVIKGRIPIEKLLVLSRRAGFGRINVHPDPCGLAVAGYLAKYLTKNDKIHGLKSWSCIGHYDGVKCKDLEYLQPSKVVFRQAYQEAISSGKTRGMAFIHAKKVQHDYIHNESHHEGVSK